MLPLARTLAPHSRLLYAWRKTGEYGAWKRSCTIRQKGRLAVLVVFFWPEGLRVIETRSEARWKGLPLAGTFNASVVVSVVLPACGVVLRSLLDRHSGYKTLDSYSCRRC